MEKAPESQRPLHNLAWVYSERMGRYDKALQLYEKSLKLSEHRTYHKCMTLNNMANIYYQRGNYKKAIEFWEAAVGTCPEYETPHYRIALSLTRLGKWEKALAHLEEIILKRPGFCDYLNLKGFILLKQKRFDEALPYFRKCLKLNPDYKKAMINMGASFCLVGEYNRAEWFLRVTSSRFPKDVLTLLWLIEVNLRTDDKEDADRYMDKLFALVNVNELVSTLKKFPENENMAPVSQDLLNQAIAGRLTLRAEMIARLGDPLSDQ
ncbi:MAG: tetratricopeptide repeat protein [Deltaproteobacteria bacterium]|nr:tetratricopeptide repeat protein [Deltaproteobacteria bacterium]